MNRLAILQNRHSIRSFTTQLIPSEILNKLKAEIIMTNTHQQGIKFQLITGDAEPFKGFSKSYGIFENPCNYMAAVVDTATPHILERAGYFAEQFVIKAVELGLGTCFVGGTYKADSVKAQLRAGEKILFLVLIGYSKEKSRVVANFMVNLIHRKKFTPKQFFTPESDYTQAMAHFPYLETGLQAVACAPSALNKRPVRIFVKEIGSGKVLCATVDESNPKNLIDLGIAKWNFNFATSTECEWGNGAPLIIEE